MVNEGLKVLKYKTIQKLLLRRLHFVHPEVELLFLLCFVFYALTSLSISQEMILMWIVSLHTCKVQIQTLDWIWWKKMFGFGEGMCSSERHSISSGICKTNDVMLFNCLLKCISSVFFTVAYMFIFYFYFI